MMAVPNIPRVNLRLFPVRILRAFALCTVLLLRFAFAAQQVYSEAPSSTPSITIKTNYYTFGGTNHAQLRAAMSAARPWRSRYDALTKWDLESSYRVRVEGAQFEISDVDVRAEVLVTLPFWLPGRPVSRDLVQRWEKCLAGLSAHEQGHVVLAKAAAAALVGRLQALPRFNSRQELAAAANQALQETLDEIHGGERRYDQVTRHGSTQGAVFPMRPEEEEL